MKIGDYVRTKYGIAKIIEIYKKVNAIQIDKTLNNFTFVLNEDINKTSPNIIDLIEVGDYVNGNKVTDINGTIYVKDVGFLEEIEIKSILTKEQFESMEYKVGEDDE